MSSKNLSALVMSHQFSLGLQNECGPRLHLGKKEKTCIKILEKGS